MANFVFLDTETTGLDDDAELVEIAVVDDTRAVLFVSAPPGDDDFRLMAAYGRLLF